MHHNFRGNFSLNLVYDSPPFTSARLDPILFFLPRPIPQARNTHRLNLHWNHY
jgi:hypothetical protein